MTAQAYIDIAITVIAAVVITIAAAAEARHFRGTVMIIATDPVIPEGKTAAKLDILQLQAEDDDDRRILAAILNNDRDGGRILLVHPNADPATTIAEMQGV